MSERDREMALRIVTASDMYGAAVHEIAAAREEGRLAERARWIECALFDALMEGPKHKGWNRSALDRLLKESQ